MRKPAVLLAVVLMSLALGQAGQGVDLEAGWYATCHGITLLGDGPDPWGATWYATSAMGEFGPILVENVGPPNIGRKITILEDLTIAPGAVLFEDYGTYAGVEDYLYPFVDVGWETNYDANRMQLRLYRHVEGSSDELVCSQSQSAYQLGHGNVWSTYPLLSGEQVVLRLVVVPEPASLLALAVGPAILVLRNGRRGRR